MNKETLHERVFALKYAVERGQANLGGAQEAVERELKKVETGEDGLVDPESVSPALQTLIEATLKKS